MRSVQAPSRIDTRPQAGCRDIFIIEILAPVGFHFDHPFDGQIVIWSFNFTSK